MTDSMDVLVIKIESLQSENELLRAWLKQERYRYEQLFELNAALRHELILLREKDK